MTIKPRIYIVEDDASIRKSLKRLLASAGFESEVFSSGRYFLECVPKSASGVLIADLRMPDGDGFSLQEKMIELGYTLKVIFITALPLDIDKKLAASAGAVGILTKPFSSESLLHLIYEALGTGKPTS